MQVDQLVAGRELDALMAEKVMGWQAVHIEDNYDPRAHQRMTILVGLLKQATNVAVLGLVPAYSTDIAAAMQVVDHWEGDVRIARQNGQWKVEFFQPSMQWGAWADSLPLAICRTALLAAAETTLAGGAEPPVRR